MKLKLISILGTICSISLTTNAMSVSMDPLGSAKIQSASEGQHLDKLNNLKSSIVQKMKIMAILLEYMDSISQIRTGKPKLTEDFNDPYILSKIEVWLDEDNIPDISTDALENILGTALRERFKRSAEAKKGKRTGEAEEAKDDVQADDSAAASEEKKGRRKKAKGKSKSKSKSKSRS